MTNRNSWQAVVLGLGTMAIAGLLAWAKVDKEIILLILAVAATPIIGAMVSGQLADIRSTAQQVKEQTNGNTSQQLEIIRQQGRLLAAMSPQEYPLPPAPGPVPVIESSATDPPGAR